ncbi:lipoyl(octanoyl) transferase LipB [Candidatus Nesciobacter abundans]|uniref:Octanoyltransferase n=1 Tax=Candidatus Nesciobacter abundans TaxID=2601668 RepID=A0A5C0UI40_9PROT|nr:lipoyl(octanoyl) transferase LipB [Candidatus Nesciobacter abundans]QEK39052.1 lipoyl(octanoyl) transferase LipB [Candidatus Nesciobacter abundans]
MNEMKHRKNITIYKKIFSVTYEESMLIMNKHMDIVHKDGSMVFFLIFNYLPVITLGVNEKELSESFIKTISEKNISYYKSSRGGKITYHDKGQFTCYPIINLDYLGVSPANYVVRLQEWMNGSIGSLGVESKKHAIGVWVKDCIWKKVGFIGVKISRKITSHGFSINLNANLDAFNMFIPCGMESCVVGNLRDVKCKSMLNEAINRNCLSEKSNNLYKFFYKKLDCFFDKFY